jgi:hypothetical protein
MLQQAGSEMAMVTEEEEKRKQQPGPGGRMLSSNGIVVPKDL